MTYNFIAEYLCILFFKSHTVIVCVLIPLFKLYYKVYRLCILNAFNTEQCFCINYSYSPKFNKMSCYIRRSSYKRLIALFYNLNNIIRYKTVSSVNKFKSHLTFTYSAFTHYQNTFTVNINQNSMN